MCNLSRTFKSFIFFLLLFQQADAQYSITGNITDSSGNALAGATVFLSNATKGTSTAADGKFTLSNIRSGRYDLIISMIGYEGFATSLLINANKEDLDIRLVPKAVSLKPYIVFRDNIRRRYLEMFNRVFIGKSDNALLCRIINPEIIYFDYDKPTSTLSASTDDFLVIENKALGYKIKFLLNKFTSSSSLSGPSLSYYEGQALYEELPGGMAKKKRWQKKRVEAYKGSSMHFFRAAAQDKLLTDGFIMHDLTRIANSDRPTDDSIRNSVLRFRNTDPAMTAATRDSISLWQRKYEMPKIIQILSRDTLAQSTVIKRTDQPGVWALTFKNLLFLSLAKKRKPAISISSIPGTNGKPYSILTLQYEHAFFDSNGILLDPQSLVFEGYWGEYGSMGDMLPSDFFSEL